MPKIFMPKKEYKREKESSKQHNLNHKAVYNTRRWRSIRTEKLKRDTLCEVCIEKDKIAAATDVHHIKAISKGKTIREKQALGFNINNLKSVCKQCHQEIHDENRSKNILDTKPERRNDWIFGD